MLSIICPTVDGREHHLARCKAAYELTTPVSFQWIQIHNQKTCGIAWNLGIAQATMDLIHLTADDLEPHPGWYEAAIEKVDRGLIPAPRILKPNGQLESCGWDNTEKPEDSITPYSRIPFAPKVWFEKIGPMLETHYANDHYFSHQALTLGWESVIARNYLFTHHWASAGRHGMARVKADQRTFEQAIRRPR